MPTFMAGIVKHAVNNYINLNVGEQLSKYSGPVTIVRRLRDEMISTRLGLSLFRVKASYLLRVQGSSLLRVQDSSLLKVRDSRLLRV